MSRDFDGVDDVIVVGDVAAIDITGTAITLACYARSDVTANKGIVCKLDNISPATYQYGLRWLVTAKAAMYVGDGTADSFDVATTTTTLSTNTWYHLAGIKNGTGANALKIFLNGIEDGSATSNLTMANTAVPLKIGATGPSGGTGLPFDGSIAEVGIWDIVLSADEIAMLAAGMPPHAIRPDRLKGYWPLYGVSSPESDFSGNNNHGTVTGALQYDHPPKISAIWRAIQPRAIQFKPWPHEILQDSFFNWEGRGEVRLQDALDVFSPFDLAGAVGITTQDVVTALDQTAAISIETRDLLMEHSQDGPVTPGPYHEQIMVNSPITKQISVNSTITKSISANSNIK